MNKPAFDLDRRWIFLAMLLAVLIPVLMRPVLPEQPTPIVQAVFDTIENLPDGSKVLLALDYDPASKPELGPMNTAFTRHCALRGYDIFFMTLWETGVAMLDDGTSVLESEFADEYAYGVNYINLGYAPGHETAIKLITTNLPAQFPVDSRGRPFAGYPISRGVTGLRDLELTISIGAGYAGTKEWVQYAGTPFPEITVVAGVTGVSAPPLYPYYPQQLPGMLPAIKGAAEYEAALALRYGTVGEALPELLNGAIDAMVTPDRDRDAIIAELAGAAEISTGQVGRMLDGRINCLPRRQMEAIAPVLGIRTEQMIVAAADDGCDRYAEAGDYPNNYLNYAHPDHQEALGRMGPQLSAHLLMLVLIITGNVIFFTQRRRSAR